MDRFSPVAPAHVRVLVLPVGRIERTHFLHFLAHLQRDAARVPLASLGIDDNDDRLLSLAPKASPYGSILFNFTTAAPGQYHQQLPPFELFREPLLVLGVTANLANTAADGQKELKTAAEYLRDRHPRVVHRQLVVLGKDGSEGLRNEVLHISNSALAGDESLGPAVQVLAARFLVELATYTRAMQASPTIQTPARIQQAKSLHENKRRSGSGSGSGHQTPPATEVSSPMSDDGASRPPSRGIASPPGTISGHMQINGSGANGLARSDSRASNTSHSGNGASQQDRISIQGFGSNTSQEKGRNRGKARVGIVLGHLHLMAGQWGEALRMLTEHTTKSRALADHLWHAKGLEGIVVCLLLLAWAGVEFQIPSLCSTTPDRANSSNMQRLPIHPPKDASATETARLASIQKLANILPDVLRQVLNLYRSGDGSLELPSLVVSEATLRFCKGLAILCRGKGELGDDELAHIVLDKIAISHVRLAEPEGAKTLSKSTVAELLGQIQPMSDDGLSTADQVSILAGMSSIYSLLQMARKRAIVSRTMVIQLTAALTRARKLGAAEMGIHPAASLSAETGAGAVLAVVEDSGGINELISQIAQTYGTELVPTSNTSSLRAMDRPETLMSNIHFGNHALKINILRDMVAFCEASPDPYGVLHLTASLLKSARPIAAVDTEAETGYAPIRQEEHARLAAVISRTIGVSKALGLPDVQATYWDPFLVRGFEFKPNRAVPKVIERSKLKATVPSTDHRTPGNPLLYDPNTSRPGTAVTPEQHILVENEQSECIVAFQNPFDMPLEVERVDLVTEGAQLTAHHKPFTLGPRTLQNVPIFISLSSVGEISVTGCRVKIFGCHEQVFPIVQNPWLDTPSPLVKDHGQNAKHTTKRLKRSHPEFMTAVATVIPKQPVISLQSISIVESSIMMLEGERQTFEVVVRNDSKIPACIFEAVGTKDILSLAEDMTSPVMIPPGESATLRFQAIGKAGVSEAQADFYYCSALEDASTSDYVRTLSVPLTMTVNASLRLQHFDVLPTDSPEIFTLLFDLGNAWPMALEYDCAVEYSADPCSATRHSSHKKGRLSSGEVTRIQLQVKRWQSLIDCSRPEDISKEVAKRLRVGWTCDARAGEIATTNMSLTSHAMTLMRGAPVQLKLNMHDTSNGQLNHLSVKAGSFVTIRACLVNHGASRSNPLFVQLHTKKADGSSYNDRHVAAAGALHRLIPPLAPSEQRLIDFVICPFITGIVDLRATVAPAVALNIEGNAWLGAGHLTINVE